jgi:hypothetical protein
MSNLGEAMNMKKNVGESPVKRTFAKLRHPTKAVISSDSATAAQDGEVDDTDVQHEITEQYASTLGQGLIEGILHYMTTEDAGANVRELSGNITEVFGESLISGELRKVVRLAGQEIVGGVSEGMFGAFIPYGRKVPKAVTAPVLLLVSLFGGLFFLGLLLALWRFALFGLH